MKTRPYVLALMLTLPATAQSDPVDTARRAVQMLDLAAATLTGSENARNRVTALSETVHAYEEGLLAVREGLRQVAVREQVLRRQFDRQEKDIARLLTVLQSIGATPAPLLTMHPGGPLAAARSGMILAEITPAFRAEAAILRTRLDELRILEALQQEAASALRNGLAGAQTARTELSQAIAARGDLPKRFDADEAQMNALVTGSQTLDSFAAGLSALPPLMDGMMRFDSAKGQLPLPVRGRVLRRFNQPDAAGVRRPGLILTVPPRALVTAPFAATIRYRGPLLDYGNVTILEPDTNYLIVMAGLAEVYGEVGQIVPQGAPIGLMGGNITNADAVLASALEGAVVPAQETLYIEVRRATLPENPEAWFRLIKE